MDWRFWVSLIGAILALVMVVILFTNGQIRIKYGPHIPYVIMAAVGFVNARSLVQGKSDRTSTFLAFLLILTILVTLTTLVVYLLSG